MSLHFCLLFCYFSLNFNSIITKTHLPRISIYEIKFFYFIYQNT
ncbi:hypothetical protein CAMSH0001_1109 [Campylobacter showae RM3277]|uniref:Uncharacterized protein n=1 Tax=Campylobacter showae RM3277 TaxID=553219 RepID=C6RHZ9_9BACT|nr:hypothetical protein CAMSH0001_1109 [Campylobacter showae RM3277]